MLYREDATGFVCEFSADPGIGYTLIDAQPTDTLENRVNWWRDVDVGNQSSEWHPSLQSGTPEVPGRDTRGGSGINIMPDDYSSFEWAGAISPVFTQAASYSRTAAAAYAGSYGVRLTLGSAGGYIGLASASGTNNIVISANSKWIVSLYVRPTTSTAQTVTVTLVTSSGSYSITGETEASSSTWKRISGVFDLSDDASLSAQLRISTSTTSAGLDFDAVMLEQKIGPYDTASAYYSPWGSGIVDDQIPDGEITQEKLWGDLSDRIDLIDNSLPGSVNARLAAQYDTLVQQISEVSVGNGQFDTLIIWYFDSSSEISGWTGTNATLAVSDGYLSVTATGNDPKFKTSSLSVDGGAYQLVRMRVQRTAGTGWTGTLRYYYSGGSSTITISEPAQIDSEYVEASWDMSDETLWKSNTITAIEIQLGTSSGDNYSLDWLGVGRNAPGASYSQVEAVRVLSDNKNRVFYQNAAPASDSNYTLKTNDLWFDTDDGYKPYRWNGASWVETTDTRLASSWAEIYDIGTANASPSGAAAQRINGINATASSKIKTYYQASTSAPSSPTVGDIWFQTDNNNRSYRWNGSSWVETSDVRIVNLTASVANKEEAKIGYCSLNPGTNTTKALCETAGGTWIDQPLATAVKQVSVTTTYGTAALETTMQANATDTGSLKTQYMVKLDVNGYVTGFGLYNAGAGASGFIIRTDKFVVGSAANNTTPFTVDAGTGVTYINAASIKDATITAAKIATLNADKITSGTIGAQTIALNGVSSILKSSNYVAGSAGWQIKGDGTAEFRNVTIRGSLNASDISGGTLNFNNFSASNISASSITTGTLNASNVSVTNLNASNITTGNLSASYISGGTFNASLMTVTNLSASSITTGTLNASNITVTNLRADSITVGTLITKQITDGAITSSASDFYQNLGWDLGNYSEFTFWTPNQSSSTTNRQYIQFTGVMNLSIYNSGQAVQFYLRLRKNGTEIARINVERFATSSNGSGAFCIPFSYTDRSLGTSSASYVWSIENHSGHYVELDGGSIAWNVLKR